MKGMQCCDILLPGLLWMGVCSVQLAFLHGLLRMGVCSFHLAFWALACWGAASNMKSSPSRSPVVFEWALECMY